MSDELTVIILTRNEAHQVRACIEAARLVSDTVLVFDSASEDETVSLAQAAGARVLQRSFDNYANQRNAALNAATTPWVFFVDADERVTPELAGEVRRAVREEDKVGWWVPRQNIIVGRWIRGGGWYPDYQLRVLRRGCARYDPVRVVHEVVILDGEAGYLQHSLIHHNYQTWAQFRAKQRRYARYEVQALRQQGVRPRPYTSITMPLREFWRRFVTLRGYVDGGHGLYLAAHMAWYTFVTYWGLGRAREE